MAQAFLHTNIDKNAFSKWVGKLSQENRDKCSNIIKASITTLERRAKNDAPSDDGILRAKIASEYGRETFGNIFGGAVYTHVFYAPYVEWGTGDSAVIHPADREYASEWWTHKKHKGMKRHPYLMDNFRLTVYELKAQLKNMGFEEKRGNEPTIAQIGRRQSL
jgi:hypothetical protein